MWALRPSFKVFMFVALVGAQFILMSDQTNAACCSPFVCSRWHGLIYGSMELQSSMAKITIGKESYLLDVDPDLAQKFKADIGPRGFGFIVIEGVDTDTYPKKPVIKEFVVADYNDMTHTNEIPAAEAVNKYNKLFDQEFSVYQKKKGGKP